MNLVGLIPWLPALAAVLCAVCACRKSWRDYAGWVCVAGIAAAFACTVVTIVSGVPAFTIGESNIADHTVKLWDWIHFGARTDPDKGLTIGLSYFVDPLTALMLCVVTGIGTLVAWYANGYMKGDPGFARFFFGVSLFIFAMTTLVLADNLVLLYLGWEGVGLCSYLLIGFYYKKPSAIAAAKKAFIVNRIGDLGFALGIFLTYLNYGTVNIPEVLAQVEVHGRGTYELADLWIPFLLMLGAFGKSAQLPLYMWLPDAMEGPTPVSALIHAATMVTAGVYMIARLLPVFELSPYALPTVAVVGGLTSLFAATIALVQYDIQRIFAYSTISQLGYMFVGVGVLSTFGGVYHLFTHAFFKALLFLTAGSVMHGLAGQLDLRKMSGLRRVMPVTCWLMFIGCLALSAVPFIASGFFSKDVIILGALHRGLEEDGSRVYLLLAAGALVTAVLTAYYTFRLWFRVFLGETSYEMGDEHHGDEDAHGHDDDHGHAHEAHEMPWMMNAPLVILAIGAIVAGWQPIHGWVEHAVEGSTAVPLLEHHETHDHASPPAAKAAVDAQAAKDAAAADDGHHHYTVFGMDTHTFMILAGFVICIVGIGTAAYFHWFNRAAADRWKQTYAGLADLLENKYYVDEINDTLIVKPLRTVGSICYVIDRMIIDGLVHLVGFLPRLAGLAVQPAQRGVLHGYGLGMAAGVAVVVLIVVLAM